MDKMRILGISGSLRKGSFNTAALRAAVALLPENVEMEVITLGDLPLFNQDLELDLPVNVRDFKVKIKAADALLISSPEYNYSISGVLKNAIDWGSRPRGNNSFDAKPGAILGASSGRFGTARAYYDLHKICSGLNILLMNYPQILISDGKKKFDESGKLIDQETSDKLKIFVDALVEWTGKLKAAGLAK